MVCEKCRYGGAPQKYGSYGEKCAKCGLVTKEDVDPKTSKDKK